MTDTVIIYTQDDCPPCTFIKNYLVNKNIKFTEKNIKNQNYKNEMMDYDAFATPFILLKGMPMYQVDMEKLNVELNITP
ncbi:glutaredoxin family protein [Staphylococcus epidermidis]|uniref:glutaredoxin family protein n=1 Tax=Staphylococcus epidermidis TaxID=1282 RepID=UPI002095EDFB|nr:glutaredoxin family protein [Staphylococcus epidermidis]MCO6333932.1 glutaredoxin family protein [Staphylococcus epidermidis]MCO6337048.1 glutaredoxin family protein [Staphylococcus epidermidis]